MSWLHLFFLGWSSQKQIVDAGRQYDVFSLIVDVELEFDAPNFLLAPLPRLSLDHGDFHGDCIAWTNGLEPTHVRHASSAAHRGVSQDISNDHSGSSAKSMQT